MTNQLERLQTLTHNAEFTAPLSPAKSLDLTVGYDEENWPIFRTFYVGQRLANTQSGKLYKVIGFTKADTIICTPSGFGHNPAIAHYELNAHPNLIDHLN